MGEFLIAEQMKLLSYENHPNLIFGTTQQQVGAETGSQ
jgi:hypothetical protein